MIANSSLHELSLVLEGIYGTTPANPAFLKKSITGTTLALSRNKITSARITPTRQITDVRLGNRTVAGDIMTELMFGDQEDMLQATFCGTWAKRFVDKTANTISAAHADNSLNDSANGFPVYAPGDVLTVSGFTGTAGNNQVVTVVSRTASKLVVTSVTPFVDDAAGEAVTLALGANVLKPGTTRRSYTILRHFTELDAENNPFHLNLGCEFNTLTLSVEPEKIITAQFAIMGRENGFAEVAPAGSVFTAASTNKPFDSFTGSCLVDGEPVSVVTALSLTVENGLAARNVVFDDRTQEPKIGKTTVSGSMSLYFEDATYLEAFRSGTKRSLVFTIVDPDGNSYNFSLPSILGTAGQADVSEDNDITIAFPFSAIYEEASGTPDALVLTRTPVAA